MPLKIDDRVFKNKPQLKPAELKLSTIKEKTTPAAEIPATTTDAEDTTTSSTSATEEEVIDDTQPQVVQERSIEPKKKAKSPGKTSPRKKKSPAYRFTYWNLAMAGVAFLLFASSLGLLLYQYYRYTRIEADIPLGVSMGGVPVGGLSPKQAAQRLQQVYLSPITVRYRAQQFLLAPESLEFSLRMDEMLTQLPSIGNTISFWQYLWGERPVAKKDIALAANYSHQALQSYLQDIAARYDTPIRPIFADPQTFITYRSSAGEEVQQAAAVPLLHEALFSSSQRLVNLPVENASHEQITLDVLDKQLRAYLTGINYDGLVNLYLMDLRDHTAYQLTTLNGVDIPNKPDVAVSGMSIMKITILTEFYRQLQDGAALPSELDLVDKSITKSSNYTSNLLINWIGDLDDNRGLFVLNQTLEKLGLQSTFMGGLYDSFEPPGYRFTPANQRKDINTVPDAYMQTTANDMGILLQGIYDCAKSGDGLLVKTFGSEFTQKECNAMIDWLSANKIGALTEAGVPEGTKVAHKHGWAAGEPIGDAALVFTPGADYVFVCYLWKPDYTYWDENSAIMTNISKAVYYHFNPKDQ